MQEHRRRLVEPDYNQEIVKILGRKHARQILNAIKEKSQTADEISKSYNIPLTKTYIMLQKLENLKLIRRHDIINEKNRRIRLYKSRINMILVHPAKDSQFDVEILGSGNIIQCAQCNSVDCTLTIDKKENKTVAKCNNCEIEYKEILSHKLKEEQQKFLILESSMDSHNMKEEQQKVLILEEIIKS